MRFILFGTAPGPVLDTLQQLQFEAMSDERYRAIGTPEQLAEAKRLGLARPVDEQGTAYLSEQVRVLETRAVASLHTTVNASVPVYVQHVRAACPHLRAAYESCKSGTNAMLAWNDVAHMLIAGWLMDLSVPYVLRQRWSGGENSSWQVLAYTTYPPDATDCGVRMHYGTHCLFGEFWVEGGQRWPPLAINLDQQDLAALSWLMEQGRSNALPSEYASAMRKLCFFGIVTQAHDSYMATIPMFSEADCTQLLQPALATAERIAEDINEQLARLPTQQALPEKVYRLAFLRLLLTRSFATLVAQEVLPQVPMLRPRSWGLWFAEGHRLSQVFYPFTYGTIL